MSLWKIFQSKPQKQHSQRRSFKIPVYLQRASLCTCLKSSYTLEAAIVIPLVAAYFVTILFFFIMLNMQCAIDEAILYAGRKTAVESSVVESEELLMLSASAYMMDQLKENAQINQYIKHGVFGINLWKSKFQEEYFLLRADYVVELPIPFWGIKQIELSSQNCFRRWTNSTQKKDTDIVYVTKNGEVYHAYLSCRVINLSVKSCSLDMISNLRGKNGQRYYECNRCDWKDNDKERVYYTDYGMLYHKDRACSAIKRDVEEIKLKDVGERRPCSFCYE